MPLVARPDLPLPPPAGKRLLHTPQEPLLLLPSKEMQSMGRKVETVAALSVTDG